MLMNSNEFEIKIKIIMVTVKEEAKIERKCIGVMMILACIL